MKIIFYSVFIGFFGIIMISCMHDLPDVSKMPQVCFNPDVLGIFQGSCASTTGCHNSSSAAGGVVLTDHPSIMKVIKAGDPDNSPAYQAIIAKWSEAMPPDKPISKEDRNLIRIWIEQGAKNIDCRSTANLVLH